MMRKIFPFWVFMHVDHIKDYGTHHFCPSAWPIAHQYVEQKMGTYLAVGFELSFISFCSYDGFEGPRRRREDNLDGERTI